MWNLIELYMVVCPQELFSRKAIPELLIGHFYQTSVYVCKVRCMEKNKAAHVLIYLEFRAGGGGRGDVGIELKNRNEDQVKVSVSQLEK